MAAEFLLASQRIEGTELLDALVTGVFLLDQDLQVAYLNTAALELTYVQFPETATGVRTSVVVQRELAWPAPGDVDRIFDCAVTQITIAQESRLLLEIEDITQHRRLTRENALLAQLGGSRLMVRKF